MYFIIYFVLIIVWDYIWHQQGWLLVNIASFNLWCFVLYSDLALKSLRSKPDAAQPLNVDSHEPWHQITHMPKHKRAWRSSYACMHEHRHCSAVHPLNKTPVHDGKPVDGLDVKLPLTDHWLHCWFSKRRACEPSLMWMSHERMFLYWGCF